MGTPMEVTMVAASNFDYPEVITKAVEKRRAREIAIQEEEAKQAMEMLKATNRQKIAEKMKTVRVAEAEAEAAYNKITGESLSNEYLELRRLEAQMEFYRSISSQDKVIIVPNEFSSPMFMNVDAKTVQNNAAQ
jgi:regulator of protease activity HflC (stomatin/prohibitin superfamily)